MKTIIMFLLACFYFSALPGFAQSQQEGLEVRIKTQKTVFYHHEPIEIHFTLTNTSSGNIPLKISEYVFLSYFVEVFDLKKVSMKERDDFFADRMMVREKLTRNPAETSSFQDLEIKPQQILGQKINLLDYYDLAPGTYILKGNFYPMTSFFNSEKVAETALVKIIIKDNPEREQEKVLEAQALKEELKRILTPEDSVKAFFEGKMSKNWDKFFYVIDLRKMIQQFPVFYEAYQKAADQEKNLTVNDFKVFLQELNTDEQLVSFDIQETVIRKTQAIATVTTASRFRDMVIKREYRFGLTLKDHWYIYGYTVIQKK